MPVTLRIVGLRARAIATGSAVAAAVVLPWALHAVGSAMGSGPDVARALLPMHLPILLVGLLAGPGAGVVAGAAAPLVAFGLTGMPAATLLPFMVLELATYGLVAGLLARLRTLVLWKVLLAQLAGRLVRLLGVVVAASLGAKGPSVASEWPTFLAGLAGIALQWLVIPLVVAWVDRREATREHR